MKMYFDGSAGKADNGDEWVTLASVATTDLEWRVFGSEWEQMLRERYPIAPFIHMYPLFHGEDPFERIVGWDRDRVNALLMDAVRILNAMDKRTFRSFVCSVNLTARSRLIAEGYDVYDPITLCVEMCYGAFSQWKQKADRMERSYLFFDRDEPYVKDFKARWLKGRTPPGELSAGGVSLAWDLIADIQEVDMAGHPPIQAADMFAWARTRGFSDKPGNTMDYQLRQLVPSTRAEIDEDEMRRKSVKIEAK